MKRNSNTPETEAAGSSKFNRVSVLKNDFSMNECRAAAEQGDADAQDLLGDCYQYGWHVHKDYAAAVEWYEKASAQGHAAAQRSLGWCYENGYGVKQSAEKSAYWYRKGAEGGDPDAQNNLPN